MTDNTQNPGGWPDAVHMAATLSRAAHDHMQKRGLACCPHDIGIVLWKAIAAEVAAREAAARREGIEMAAEAGRAAMLKHEETGLRMGLRPTIGGAALAAYETIRALLEDGR